MSRPSLWIPALAAALLWAACSPASAAEPLHARIDRLLRSKPFGAAAPTCTDAEFLRRTSLTLNGTIPTATEARRFLDDKSPDKRAKLVDRLLQRPEYLRRMTDFFDVMFTERRRARVVKAAEWRKYLYDSLAADKPYNVLAREILAGKQTAGKPQPAARFYFDRAVEPNQLTRDVGRIFFGKDLQCAQCHNHPLVDNYFQSDYYGLYAFLNRTYQFTDKKKKLTMLGEKAEGTVSFLSVFTKTGGRTLPRLPGEPQIYDPVYPKGADTKAAAIGPDEPKFSRRELLAKEATAGKNVAFNRNIANRLWRMMFGRGLVEPVDFLHPDNPPSHPELLDLLAADFAKSKYDVKSFLREIAVTEIYQRSFETPRDLTPPAPQLALKIPQLEAEKKRLGKVRLTSELAVTKIEKEMKPLKDAIAKIEDELAKANAAIAAAQKKAAPAEKALATARTQLAAKQAVLDALNAALKATATVAKQLPKDKDIAGALKTFQTKSATTAKQVDALKKTVATRQATLKPLADKVVAAQKPALTIIARLNAARAKLAPVDKRLAEATAKWKADQTAANTVGKQLELAKTYAALTQARKTLAVSHEAQKTLAKRQAEMKQQVAALSAKLKQVLDLAKRKSAAESAVAARKSELAKRQSIGTVLAEAAKVAAAAKATLPKDAELAKAVATLTAKSAAATKRVSALQATVASQQQALADVRNKYAAAAKPVKPQLAEFRSKQAELAKLASQFAAAKSKADAAAASVDETRAKLTKQLTNRFAVRPLQPLSPEQMAWSVMDATGFAERYHQSEIAAFKKKNPKSPLLTDPKRKPELDRQIERAVAAKMRNNIAIFVRLFGAGAGQPQDEFFATVDQALYLSNNGQIRGWLNPSGANLTARLLKLKTPAAVADELYLSVLTRRPTAAEVADVTNYLKPRTKDRPAALQELAWGLLTSAEFRFNH